MNSDILVGKWDQLRGEVKSRWGKLTDNHLDEIKGDRTKLIGKIKEQYGTATEEIEDQVKAWEKLHSL